jgi:xanthine dehydrogenase iron-sulfur cluster and FAD-binding subunit A
MVQYAAGKLAAGKFVSIAALRELRGIEVAATEIRIGAGCTYTGFATRYRGGVAVAGSFRRLTGGIANQNRGTWAEHR